jgi:hypothetical protein
LHIAFNPYQENLMLARQIASSFLCFTSLSCIAACSAVEARSALVEVQIVDRTTGTTLPVYRSPGHAWVAGVPGHKYSVSISNRTPGRVLTVLSVDGVNAVSGETALAEQLSSQSGYVLSPREHADIAGWRKSQAEIASFNFTALDDAYASRTGRPDQVGVVGVAVFREREQAPVAIAPAAPIASSADEALAASAAAPAATGANTANEKMRDRAGAARLGTGHGERESSWVAYTAFERRTAQPEEIIAIHYDRKENLIAMGIIPQVPMRALPDPFPSKVAPVARGFVADPPSF